MYPLNPLLARARGRLGLPNDYKSQCARHWVIDAGHEAPVSPAVFETADLERISGVSEVDTVPGEIAKATSLVARHAPTIAYELRDAVLSGGHLYTAKAAVRLETGPLSWVARRATGHMREAVLANSHHGLKYFGHWMTDDLTLAIAAQELGTPVSALVRPTPHQAQYLDILKWNLPVKQEVFFDKITVLEDYGQNAYKRRRYGQFRDIMAQRLGLKPLHHGVMLLRGTSGQKRTLVNESEVADSLRVRGFEVLSPESTSAEALARACFGAAVIIGVEGSQLVHGMSLMSTTGTLVELQPPSRFNVLFRGRCACEGIGYGFQVGHPCGDGDDFSIDISAMNRLLDRLPASLKTLHSNSTRNYS